MAGEMLFTELLPQRLQGKPDMPPRCAACPANMYADHSLRLAQEIVTKNFFLRLLRQKGKGGGKLRMIQNGGLAAGGKKIFFKLLRLGKLDKLFTHQIIKETSRSHLRRSFKILSMAA